MNCGVNSSNRIFMELTSSKEKREETHKVFEGIMVNFFFKFDKFTYPRNLTKPKERKKENCP